MAGLGKSTPPPNRSPPQTSDIERSDSVEEYMPRDDAELLARAGWGDQSAFATLYNAYETDLYRFVVYLADGPDTAEELFQDTWLRVVRHLGKKPVVKFKPWLFTIAMNLYRDELRKRKIRRLFMGAGAGDAPYGGGGSDGPPAMERHREPAAEGIVVRDALDKAMKKLTPLQRATFVLVHVEGFKIREAAQIIGKPEGSIKSTLHRALKTLRAELKEFRP
jgi:RNA polymerase sigma-70 factor (ECF subfamily)